MRDRSLREIAMELTNRNIPTPRGGDVWKQVTVMRLIAAIGHHGQMNGGPRNVAWHTGEVGKIPRQGTPNFEFALTNPTIFKTSQLARYLASKSP